MRAGIQCRIRILSAAAIVSILMACVLNKAPASDPTPPTVGMRVWEKTPQGTQGAQIAIDSGGQITVPPGWLGKDGATNKADVRVMAEDEPGVLTFKVSGSIKGKCSTKGSQPWQSPFPLEASFVQEKKAKSGSVQTLMGIHLDDVLGEASCGFHQYGNMPKSEEFFIHSGTWTIEAEAENCCGGQTKAVFTVIVQ